MSRLCPLRTDTYLLSACSNSERCLFSATFSDKIRPQMSAFNPFNCPSSLSSIYKSSNGGNFVGKNKSLLCSWAPVDALSCRDWWEDSKLLRICNIWPRKSAYRQPSRSPEQIEALRGRRDSAKHIVFSVHCSFEISGYFSFSFFRKLPQCTCGRWSCVSHQHRFH